MHYYQFNIKTYSFATKHLSNMEDLAYRRLIDLYYDGEKPLVNDAKTLAKKIGMRDFQPEIDEVLSEFFLVDGDTFRHEKADKEIAAYHSRLDVARSNGKKGGRPKQTQTQSKPKPKPNPKQTQSVNLANPNITTLKANQEPITNNKEQRTINQEPSVSSSHLESDSDTSLNTMSDLQNYDQMILDQNDLVPIGTGECKTPFERFWEAYGKKEKRAACEKKWKTKKLDPKIDLLLADIANRDSNCYKWRIENGVRQFKSGPLPYLNGELWNDEIQTYPMGGQKQTQQEKQQAEADEWADFEKQHGSSGDIQGECHELN